MPAAVEVISENSTAIVSHDHPIDVDHRNDDPGTIVRDFCYFFDESFHHPRSYSLSGVLTGKGYNKGLGLYVLIDYERINGMSENGISDMYFGMSVCFEHLIEMSVGIGWLWAKLNLLVLLLKNKLIL